MNLYRLEQLLFSEGWFFFVPYLFFYLCFKFFNLNIIYLQIVFILLHLFNSILFIKYIYKSYRKNQLYDLLFWLSLLLLFLIPGAYLEFPSDAHEHFRRIFEWQAATKVADTSVYHKFTYFWGWTFMSELEPLNRRTALNMYSAFWQFLLAYQFYLFALRLGFSKSWSKVQVIGTICLFGTNVFSFYRYYALSSTPLAYIAYIRSLIVTLDFCDGKRKKAIALIFLIPIIYYNHYQELLLFIISIPWIYIAKLYEKQHFFRKKLNFLIIITLIIGLVGGIFLTKNFQAYATLIAPFWNDYFGIAFKNKIVSVFTIDPLYWSDWGIPKIWNTQLPYYQTLGVHGCLSILFSLIFWRKYKLLSILTITPILMLFFLPLTLFIAAIEGIYTTFRILFAFPFSFMLVLGIKEILDFLLPKLGGSKIPQINKYWISIFIIFLLSCQPSMPWRGRLWFLLYQPPAQLSLENIDITAQWFFENRQLDSKCLLISDSATLHAIATHLAILPPERLRIYNPSEILNTYNSLTSYLQDVTEPKICGFLMGIPEKIAPVPISKVAQLSGHWYPDLVRKNFDYTQEFVKAAAALESSGWAKTFVPPFYWLYEAPSLKNNKSGLTDSASPL